MHSLQINSNYLAFWSSPIHLAKTLKLRYVPQSGLSCETNKSPWREEDHHSLLIVSPGLWVAKFSYLNELSYLGSWTTVGSHCYNGCRVAASFFFARYNNNSILPALHVNRRETQRFAEFYD